MNRWSVIVKGQFLLSSGQEPLEGNIFADKSALILEWLLMEGINLSGFSIREVSKQVGVSVGLVQKVFSVLVSNGFLRIEGIRTAKRFFLHKPTLLLESWLSQYSITKKCKLRTYRSGLQDKTELVAAIKNSNMAHKVALALHSAAEARGYKNTNLNTFELYLLDPADRLIIEKILQLEPQERGYEVLLIEPYYKSMLNLGMTSVKSLLSSPILLTFLELYHYPLRGQEQAEFMAERVPELKRIYKTHLS